MDGAAAPGPVSLSSPLGLTSIFSWFPSRNLFWLGQTQCVLWLSARCHPTHWTPVCRIQTKLKVIWALLSVHLLKLWEGWQAAAWAPALYPNTKSKQKRQTWTLQFCNFFLNRFFFKSLHAFEKPPELLSRSASQINHQKNANVALKGVLSKGRWWWKPCCPSLPWA